MQNDHSTNPKIRFRGSVEACAYLKEAHGVQPAAKTLDKLRSVGGGPEFQKFGRHIVYEKRALDEWATEKLGRPMRSTSEAVAPGAA